MFSVGRLCVKLAGRDSGKKCVIIEVLEKNYVLVDGETRRKKVNVLHLEPLEQTIDIKAKASHEDVKKALQKIGIISRDTKPKKAANRPKTKREEKSSQASAPKEKKKAEKPQK